MNAERMRAAERLFYYREKATLIYDGACGFCRRWDERVRRGGVHLVEASGTVHRAAAAGREVLRRLPGGWRWALPLRVPRGLALAEHLYVWVTHRWGSAPPRFEVRRQQGSGMSLWRCSAATWGSTAAERQRPFPCDGRLHEYDDALYRAVDVDAPARILFRWLCQLKVAPYSYDWIDNLGRRSPRRLIPGLEKLAVGQRVMGFELVEFEPGRHLTLLLRGSRAFGDVAVTYLVVPEGERCCRLLVKLLLRYPRLPGVRAVACRVVPVLDLVMMRKQLLTLKQLAEHQAREEERPTADGGATRTWAG